MVTAPNSNPLDQVRRARRRARACQPFERLVPGDLVAVCQSGEPYEDEGYRDKIRIWEVDGMMFDFITIGTLGILVEVIRPVIEFDPPSPDSHWTAVLIGEKMYETLSDELELVSRLEAA